MANKVKFATSLTKSFCDETSAKRSYFSLPSGEEGLVPEPEPDGLEVELSFSYPESLESSFCSMAAIRLKHNSVYSTQGLYF